MFHAFYDEHLYLPLLVYDQDGDLVAAVLPPVNRKARAGWSRSCGASSSERARSGRGAILTRGDSGFASLDRYAACEERELDFRLGLGPNRRRKKIAAPLQEKAKRRFLRTNEKARLVTSTRYRARRRWPRSYRVLIKASTSQLGSTGSRSNRRDGRSMTRSSDSR